MFNLHPLTSSYSSLHGADISLVCSVMERRHSEVSFTAFSTQLHHNFLPLQRRAMTGCEPLLGTIAVGKDLEENVHKEDYRGER
jgi:hypothetical protein